MAHGNRKVSDEQLIEEFRDTDEPYLTASELADRLSMTRQGVHSRLMDLYKQGTIERKKTGRTVGWWLSTNQSEGNL